MTAIPKDISILLKGCIHLVTRVSVQVSTGHHQKSGSNSRVAMNLRSINTEGYIFFKEIQSKRTKQLSALEWFFFLGSMYQTEK